MRIIFMGTPDYATCILSKILTLPDVCVPLVVTQQDKPVGRKQVLTPPHIKKWLLEKNIETKILQPHSLREAGVKETLASVHPDLIIVAAYGQILPKEILDLAPCINLHASILPSYRGASPIQSSILHQDQWSGVTAMLMEEGLDSGDILALRYVALGEKNVGELFDALATAAADLTLRVIENFPSIQPLPQVNADASYCKKIKKNDGLIDFFDEAKTIYTKYKALTPWPGIFLESGLKIKALAIGDDKQMHHDKAGMIESISEEAVSVLCHKGSLKIKKVQAPSKKEILASEYIRGKRQTIGDFLV
ncbi:methionyl-tRNA formyltransferase [Sulfurospirillum sp. 1612]|uniref:methionyl-tRNA formyltransferase n=1 Tax=Sulfurospirillum sp. 1612 TaxID=3094835 RepID=UPI002F94B3D2